MPTSTLLECLNKYIPDNIFKDIVLEPNEFSDNWCIIIDGQGCPGCYKFTKDIPLHKNLIMDKEPLKHNSNFFNMLRMKLWAIECPYSRWGFDNEEEAIHHIYNLYTFKCNRCEQIQYEGPFCCMYCGTCICKRCKFPNKWGFSIGCLARLCRVCYTNDQDASIEIIDKKCYIHYSNKKIEYICPIPSGNADYSTKCWKHSVV